MYYHPPTMWGWSRGLRAFDPSITDAAYFLGPLKGLFRHLCVSCAGAMVWHVLALWHFPCR